MANIGAKYYNLGHGNLVIRSAQIEDAEEFLSYIMMAQEETDFLMRSPGEFQMTLEEEQRFIANKLSDSKDILLTARYNGILVGSLGTNSTQLNRYNHKMSFGISILKSHWGLGIGKKLIEAMIEWADANGIVKITLEVDTLNSRGIHLYESMGFVREGLLKMDRRMENMEFRDSLIMARINPFYCRSCQ